MTPSVSAAVLLPQNTALPPCAERASTPIAGALPVLIPAAHPSHVAAVVYGAAQRLLPHLGQGQRIDAAILCSVMTDAFGSSDAAGGWDWKLAYEATEAASVLFLRRHGPALIAKAGSPDAMLSPTRPD
jgi:hypothetical protein